MTDSSKRICIIGPSSSGKSTLAQRLGEKMNLPVLHMDQIAHIPGTKWKRRPLNETQLLHDNFICKEHWLVEGNYQKFMPQRFERADTVIFLHFNRFGCLYRFIKRSLQKSKTRAGMLEGGQESLNLEMMHYILFKTAPKLKIYSEILKNYPHLNVIHVYNFKQSDELVKNL